MSDRPDRSPEEDGPEPQSSERPAEPVVAVPNGDAPEPVVAEPRGEEPDVEPIPVQTAAPIQIAPDPGAAPVAVEPSAPEPERPEPEHSGTEAPDPAAAPETAAEAAEPPSTEETLALPPAIPEPPPPPPEHMPALEGVAVPFAAPPAERNSGRFAATLAVSIGGGVAIVIAVVIALFVSLFTLTESYLDKIGGTAEAFIADIGDEQWDDAYGYLCPDLRDQPVEAYVDEWDSWGADGADVQQPRDEMSGTYVPVELADGSTVELRILIEQDAETVDATICGWSQAE